MQNTPSDTLSRPGQAETSVPVWSLAVRLFHWGLVLTIAVALLTGFFAEPDWINVHLTAGAVAAALILFRIVLGLFATGPAGFAAFAYRPAETLAYLKALRAGTAPHYRGHNPAGALMVFALIALIVVLAVTGAIVLGGIEKRGPLAFLVDFALGRDAKEIHETLTFLLLGLIGLHVVGVVFATGHDRINLVGAMVHGNKPDRPHADPRSAMVGHGRAAALGGGIAVLASAAAVALFAALPAKGVPVAALDPLYKTECGDCHTPYHPSLLPASSWQAMMADLGDHFGENASLPPDKATAIAAYFDANSAEIYDTKAANWLRRVDTAHPFTITATPFWQRRHDDIPEPVFKSKAVGAKGACQACHGDAETGMFAAAAIAIPDVAKTATRQSE